jgi:hypothetical protein
MLSTFARVTVASDFPFSMLSHVDYWLIFHILLLVISLGLENSFDKIY